MNAYDRLGERYSTTRHPDPSIARSIALAIGDARTIVNVGAGTGSYEPRDRRVVAVEPSQVMLAQRPPGAAPAVRAFAEALPFAADSFEAAVALLTVHHWSNARSGLAEMRRVARRRVVVLTWDQEANEQWWLPMIYFPGIREIDRRRVISIDFIAGSLGAVKIQPIPIPHDCRDGFDIAFWRRPQAYLDPNVTASMSNFALLNATEREEGARQLKSDLEDGTWTARFGHLLDLNELDLGLRLVIFDMD